MSVHKKNRGPFQGVNLPEWFYMGEYSGSGTDTSVTWPVGANCVVISAEDDKVYYDLGGQGAGTGSPGYVPADSVVSIGPLANPPATLELAYAGSAIGHWQFFEG